MTESGSDGIEPFELFALNYARHTGRRHSDNFVTGLALGGDLHEAGSDLAYYVWVARRSDRLFVIDTGFDEPAAAARGRRLLIRPAAALASLGIEARRVDDVILTHLHYDHAGTLGDFGACRFHVQDREAAFATGRCMCHAALRTPYDVEDVVGFVRSLYAGRVVFHDEVEHLADGLSIHRTGGHTPGLQVVRVLTRRGWVVIASDAAHLYANFERGVAFPVVHNVGELLEGYRTLRRLAASADHIVPGHDPKVMDLYPPPSPELAGKVVRLDVAPGGGWG